MEKSRKRILAKKANLCSDNAPKSMLKIGRREKSEKRKEKPFMRTIKNIKRKGKLGSRLTNQN